MNNQNTASFVELSFHVNLMLVELTAVAARFDGTFGAPGIPGVTAFDAVDAGPMPALFVAVTVNVYAVPFDRPDTVTVVAPVVVALTPPGDAVTV